MQTTKKPYPELDLKPYQPFGIPLLKFLLGITILTLLATAAYEFLI